jgi:hypothetical protein
MLEAGSVGLPEEIGQWDYQRELTFACSVMVDRVALATECELEIDSELTLVVMASSSGTKIERKIAEVQLPMLSPYEVTLEASLAGVELGGRLVLTTLVVARSPRPTGAFAASLPGSILWREVHATHLEGVGPQFPTDSEPFDVTRPDIAQAGWVLSVDSSDLDALFTSCVRLTLNDSRPIVQQLLAGLQTAEVQLLQHTLDTDVTRQLVQLALRLDEVVEAGIDPDATTLLGVLRNLLASLWPTTSIASLRLQMEESPERIEAKIQHARRLTE